MKTAAPYLPRQRRAGAASPAEQLIDPLGAFADHPTIDDHLHFHVVNTVRQAAGIHFMVAHGEVLDAQQPTVTGEMHLARRRQKGDHRRGRLAVVEDGGAGLVPPGKAVNLTGRNSGHRSQGLQVPGVKHPAGKAVAGEIALIHGLI